MFIRQVLILIAILILSMPVYAVAYEHEIKSISSSISDSIAKSGKKRIAVVDFTDLQGNVTELGRFLAEELSIDLTNTARGFVIIDRTHLKTLLKEHKLSISGLVDPATAKKLGQIAGVDAIVTGSVTPLGKSVKVSCKVIATDTAMVIGASKGEIARTRGIDELLDKEITTDATGQIGTPKSESKPKLVAKPGVFQNDLFKITVKSAIKRGSATTLLLLYENISNRNIKMDIFNDAKWTGMTLKSEYPYLTDENGEKWTLMSVANIGFTWTDTGFNLNPSIFLPGVPTLVRLTFSAKGNTDGTLFTAIIEHGETSHLLFRAVIPKIRLNE